VTDSKKCPGVPMIGRPAHEAGLPEFAKNAARPDGLARQCRACGAAYTKALKAKKAGGEGGSEVASTVTAQPPVPLPDTIEQVGSPEGQQALEDAAARVKAERRATKTAQQRERRARERAAKQQALQA
jgi:hypothetical protein